MNLFARLSILAGTIAAASTVAYASQGSVENDATAIANAKIPLAQAVSTAEQHAGGKALRAEYENSKHGWVYDVEFVGGSKVVDVNVDADRCTVISSSEDKADRDHDKKN